LPISSQKSELKIGGLGYNFGGITAVFEAAGAHFQRSFANC
jgi:hypothetical protein